MVERRLESARHDAGKFVRIVCNAAASSAKRKARADDEWPGTYLLRDGLRLVERMGAARLRHVEAKLRHCRLEEVTVFRTRYGRRVCADHLYAAFGKNARFCKSGRHI